MTSTAACFRARCDRAWSCGLGSDTCLGCRCRRSSVAFVWEDPGPADWSGRRHEWVWWWLGSGSFEGVSLSGEGKTERAKDSIKSHTFTQVFRLMLWLDTHYICSLATCFQDLNGVVRVDVLHGCSVHHDDLVFVAARKHIHESGFVGGLNNLPGKFTFTTRHVITRYLCKQSSLKRSSSHIRVMVVNLQESSNGRSIWQHI